MFTIYVIGMASGVEQLDRPDGKVLFLGNVAAKDIMNQTNIINLTNVTDNATNQTQMNISGLQGSIFPTSVNELTMETPSQADSQSGRSRYEWSSLGK